MPADVVLVTGASGFVGRQVLAPLAAGGFAVHATARRVPAAAPAGVAWHACDLLQPDTAAALLAEVRPAVLVHAAWYARHGLFWTAPENDAWVAATLALAAAFRKSGGRRFVGVGSCAEYDWTLPSDQPWPESRPLAPATPYGRAKQAAADALQSKVLTPDSGASFAWARLFHLFGEDEQPGRLVPSVIDALLAGRAAAVGSGQAVRDFAETAFVGRALAALAASAVTGPVNVASGTPVRIADLVRRLAELCGQPDLLRLGALPDRPGEPPYMVADITRLRREVGFAERPDLQAGLAAAVHWRRRAAAAAGSEAALDG